MITEAHPAKRRWARIGRHVRRQQQHLAARVGAPRTPRGERLPPPLVITIWPGATGSFESRSVLRRRPRAPLGEAAVGVAWFFRVAAGPDRGPRRCWPGWEVEPLAPKPITGSPAPEGAWPGVNRQRSDSATAPGPGAGAYRAAPEVAGPFGVGWSRAAGGRRADTDSALRLHLPR